MTSYMAEVAKLLGVELGESFRLEKYNCYFPLNSNKILIKKSCHYATPLFLFATATEPKYEAVAISMATIANT